MTTIEASKRIREFLAKPTLKAALPLALDLYEVEQLPGGYRGLEGALGNDTNVFGYYDVFKDTLKAIERSVW